MPAIKPNARPQLKPARVRELLSKALKENPESKASAIIEACPAMLFANRGYFRNTLGRLGLNDYNVYDDAIFLVTPSLVMSFNANCDPVKTGFNKGVGKNYAQLMPGVWPFCQGHHKKIKEAFRQMTPVEAFTERKLNKFFTDQRRIGQFTVRRVEKENVGKLEWGLQNINIHPGSESGTSSWGCQTLPPDQWIEFQTKTYAAMNAFEQTWIPYVLTEDVIA